LEKLPFDKLKTDQSFVTDIEKDVTKRKILNGVIQLTHSLGMQVVAERAETLGEKLCFGNLMLTSSKAMHCLVSFRCSRCGNR
jgi:predicted signal transduction protein with EAL and GGDEF domain